MTRAWGVALAFGLVVCSSLGCSNQETCEALCNEPCDTIAEAAERQCIPPGWQTCSQERLDICIDECSSAAPSELEESQQIADDAVLQVDLFCECELSCQERDDACQYARDNGCFNSLPITVRFDCSAINLTTCSTGSPGGEIDGCFRASETGDLELLEDITEATELKTSQVIAAIELVCGPLP